MGEDFVIWSGNDLQGWAFATSEEEAQRIKAIQMRAGLRVKIRRKYETFSGERMVCTPYSAKVYWEP